MYIAIPKPIPITDAPEPLTLATFVRWLVDSDDRFNGGGPGIRAGSRVLDAFDLAARPPVETSVDVSKDDLAILQAAAEKPTQERVEVGYPVRPSRMLVPFLDAIANATAERPVVAAAHAATDPAP